MEARSGGRWASISSSLNNRPSFLEHLTPSCCLGVSFSDGFQAPAAHGFTTLHTFCVGAEEMSTCT